MPHPLPKKINLRKACLKHYYNNYEYCIVQQKLYKQNARRVKKEKEANNNNKIAIAPIDEVCGEDGLIVALILGLNKKLKEQENN